MKRRSVLQPILAVILIGIAILTSLISYWIWVDIKEERYTDLESTASILDRYNKLSMIQRELALVSVGRRMLDIKGKNVDERRLQIGKDALEIYKEFLAFGLTRPDGSMITFTGNVEAIGAPNLMNSPLTQRSFLYAKSVNRISIGEPYYFEQVNDWVLPIRTPLFENDSLIALNTSAIQYKSINDNLESFGFNERYRIHAINTVFNTTQIYYPLDVNEYSSLLRKNADIYRNFEIVENKKGFNRIKGFNTFEKNPIIGVQTISKSRDRSFIVIVDRNILTQSFWERTRFIFLVYLVLSTGVFLGFNYLSRKDHEHKDELQTGRDNLASLFESSNSMIGLFDTEKRLIEFNQSFTDFCAIADNINLKIGMNMSDEMSNRKTAAIFSSFQDRALKGEKFTEITTYPVRDESIFFQLSCNPIYHKGKITGISMFVDDVSELKKSQKELEKYSSKLKLLVDDRTKKLKTANVELKNTNNNLKEALENLKKTQNHLIQSEKMASLGVLAAGVGHEINNPLNFIQGGLMALVGILEDDKSNEEGIQTYLDVIEEGVRRCSAITESLSNYSRHGMDMNENCDIKSILDNCLLILGSQIKAKIKIEKKYVEDKVLVKGNAGKLHQVFLNILTNANQAIRESGIIVISYTIDEKNVGVQIKDTGEGIEKKDLLKIGDPFFTTKAPGKGTGLGLSIAYSIIEEHNGTIKCYSKKNEGTEFVIKLPFGI